MTISRILNHRIEVSFFLVPGAWARAPYLRSAFPDAHVVDLLSEATYHRLLANPGLLAAELRAVPEGQWVIMDEIQRLPSLLNEVHRFIEERKLRFVLCGSSARKLKRAGVNQLAGRALRRAMHPFVPEELGSRFDLEDALRNGLLPIVWDSEDRSERSPPTRRCISGKKSNPKHWCATCPASRGFFRWLRYSTPRP